MTTATNVTASASRDLPLQPRQRDDSSAAAPQASTQVERAVGEVRRVAFELSATDQDEACRLLREALQLRPGHADLLGDLAALHLQGGRYAQSIQAAREALAADPQHDESAYALAIALLGDGRVEEALSTFEDLAWGGRAERFVRCQPELAAQCREQALQLGEARARNAPPAGRPAAAAVDEAQPTPTAASEHHAEARPDNGGAAPVRPGRPRAPKAVRPAGLGGLLAETAGIEELSLDCFDTILWRDTDKPIDVFYAMQHRPAFRAAGIDALARVRAERHARNLQRVRTDRLEVNLEQIYRAACPDASADLLRWLAEDELAAEMQACRAHPGAVQLLRQARARGIAVTIVSDTYFGESQLRRLLEHALPADAFAAITGIVCSSDHGVCKTQGLLRLARLHRAVDPATVLHVGDDKDADVAAPRAIGMSATQLIHELGQAQQRRRLGAVVLSMLDPTVRSQRPLHMPYRAVHATCGTDDPPAPVAIGHAAVGPVMHAFARWIEDEAACLAATRPCVKLMFLMRDAHLPLLTYRAISGGFDAHAVHLSRFSALAASFRSVENVEHYLATLGSGMTVELMARQLLLSEATLQRLRDEAKASSLTRGMFFAAVRQPEVLQEILDSSAAYRARLHRYLERETGMRAGDTVVLVDLGYNGTIQRALTPVARHEWGVELQGRYLMTVGPVDETRRSLIDRSWLDDRALATLQPYVGLLETLVTARGGSVVGYAEDGTPTTEGEQVVDVQAGLAEAIQQQSLRFAREAEAFFRASGRIPSSTLLRDEALASFARLLFLPTETELQHLAQFRLEINLGSGITRRLFDTNAGLEGLRRHGMFYLAHAQNEEDLRMTVPAELRAAGLELSVALLSQHRFGLELARSDWSTRTSPLTVFVSRGDRTTQARVDAMPTHDGWFAALLPLGDGDIHLGLALGQDHVWIQLHALELLSADGSLGQREGADLRLSLMLDGAEDHGHGLLRFADAQGLLMIPAGSSFGTKKALARIVFRPLVAREQPA